jgi:hypothetical protein
MELAEADRWVQKMSLQLRLMYSSHSPARSIKTTQIIGRHSSDSAKPLFFDADIDLPETSRKDFVLTSLAASFKTFTAIAVLVWCPTAW